jgi:hypothetical protein
MRIALFDDSHQHAHQFIGLQRAVEHLDFSAGADRVATR